MKILKDIALNIAEKLEDKWSIGESSIFCDEVDWDAATTEQIAELIEKELIELQTDRVDMFTRGYELGSSNNISLPDALETEFGKQS